MFSVEVNIWLSWVVFGSHAWEECRRLSQHVVTCDRGRGSALALVLSIVGHRTILKRGLSCIQVRREYYCNTAPLLVSILVLNSHLNNSQLQ